MDYHILFVYSSADGYLDYYHLLAIKNNTYFFQKCSIGRQMVLWSEYT